MYFQYTPFESLEQNIDTLTAFMPYLKMVHMFNVDDSFNRYTIADEHSVTRVIGGVNLSIYQSGAWHEECKDDGKTFVRAIEAIVNKLAGKPSMITTPGHGRQIFSIIEALYKNQL